MVDPVMGYWWTQCVCPAGHRGAHFDFEGYSRYPFRNWLRDVFHLQKWIPHVR